jgi:hypothetical protein
VDSATGADDSVVGATVTVGSIVGDEEEESVELDSTALLTSAKVVVSAAAEVVVL